MQEPLSRPWVQKQRRPSTASSTFFPHRAAPPPVPPLPSPAAYSTSPAQLPYSQSYASYSRPRRHSLSTSSSPPPSPTFLHSPSSPISPIRQPLSSASIRALRRRDITHPSSFEGAQIVGKRNSSISAPTSSTEEADLLGTSAETAATSVFSEDLPVPPSPLTPSKPPRLRDSTDSSGATHSPTVDDSDPPFPIELDTASLPPPYESRARVKSSLFDRIQLFGQSQSSTILTTELASTARASEDELDARLAESVETAKRSTLILDRRTAGRMPSVLPLPPSAPLKLQRSFTRLFSIRRQFENAHHANPLPQARSLSRFIEPITTPSILRGPSQKRQGRPRSISLPSPDLVKTLKEEDPVDTILRTGAYDKRSLRSSPPPRPPRPFSPLFYLPGETPFSHKAVLATPSHSTQGLPDAPTDEEEIVEVLDNGNDGTDLNKRLSIVSHISSQASSTAPYRSIFDMFNLDDRQNDLYEAPRAESCTIPDLPSFTPSHNRLASLDLARPDSPSSVYPPTIAISEFEEPPFPARRRLLGPRPPSSLFAPSLLSSNRQSSASTALSGFGDFPFPPNFTVPTPPLPSNAAQLLTYPAPSTSRTCRTVGSPLRSPVYSPELNQS
ncbi:hypothetical protein JCM5353_005357 [Sporobolomyces roseus]